MTSAEHENVMPDTKVSTTESLIFDGGKYALMCFRKEDGRYRYILYEEYGRKLKHGKRRRPVANVDVAAVLNPRVYIEEDNKDPLRTSRRHLGPRMEEILEP